MELNNPKTRAAIQLTARSDYLILGWTPRYLVSDLLQAISDSPLVRAIVLRVNQVEIPPYRRVLVEFGGTLPPKFEPMSSKRFQVITPPTRQRRVSTHRKR